MGMLGSLTQTKRIDGIHRILYTQYERFNCVTHKIVLWGKVNERCMDVVRCQLTHGHKIHGNNIYTVRHMLALIQRRRRRRRLFNERANRMRNQNGISKTHEKQQQQHTFTHNTKSTVGIVVLRALIDFIWMDSAVRAVQQFRRTKF